MGGDPTGGDADQGQASNPFIRQREGYTVTNSRGDVSYRTPVLNEKGEQVGFMSEPQIPGLATAIASLGGGTPQVYTGDPRYNPSANQGNFNSGGGGSSQPAVDPFAQQRAELAAARANRANALADKQSQLAAAFGAFNNDFYDDLGGSFIDYQNPLLAQSYDDSLRGIYEGFKAKGLLSQH